MTSSDIIVFTSGVDDTSAKLALLAQCRAAEHFLSGDTPKAFPFVEEYSVATLAEIEKVTIVNRLSYFNGNKTATAKSLGIALKSLYNKLHRYGISL